MPKSDGHKVSKHLVFNITFNCEHLLLIVTLNCQKK